VPTVRTVFPTTSLKSARRVRRATLLSRAFRLGDGAARFSLQQRHCGFLSLSSGMPWPERLALANAARARNVAARKLEKERTAAQAGDRKLLEQTRDL
jgi:hypothetical protein